VAEASKGCPRAWHLDVNGYIRSVRSCAVRIRKVHYRSDLPLRALCGARRQAKPPELTDRFALVTCESCITTLQCDEVESQCFNAARAAGFTDLAGIIRKRYAALFPRTTWCGLENAIFTMSAEILSLRADLAEVSRG
jgi:hypothetical protein